MPRWRRLLNLQDIFGTGNFFLELQDHGLPAQKRVNPAIIEMAKKTGIPLVCTNDTHYLRQDDSVAHDVLLCIGTGKIVSQQDRMRYESDQFYFKSCEEMKQLWGEIPEALENTLRIAERCNLQIETSQPLPPFDVPPGYTSDTYFEKVVREGFAGTAQASRRSFCGRKSQISALRLRRTAGLRNRDDQEDEVLELFPDRLGSDQVCPRPLDSGRSRPRLRRRQPGRLQPAHHRHRSAAVRAVLRALPESRTHRAARYRYGFLHEPPGGSDRVCRRTNTGATTSARSSPSAPWRPKA